MMRSFISALLGICSVVAIGSLPAACQSGGVGDPCVPEDEYNPRFAGFKVTEDNIESRSFQCQTRICLANHFQGRVSCPLGQPPPTACDPNGLACPAGQSCRQSAVFAPECDPESDDQGASDCAGRTCNKEGRFCECASATDCPLDGLWFCNADDKLGPKNQCLSFVCATVDKEDNVACQRIGATEEDNTGKACCVPGTDTPVAAPVCGQCAADSNRNAEKAVYCSCRCGPADPPIEEDDNFNFCDCPNGFTCAEIRKNVGIGDALLAGKYCVIEGSEFKGEQQCGQVKGYYDSQQCKGIGL